ncbi:MAG: long-chain-fatty-acid--CoA ligase [Alphaproteobacteria bacterium]|nr:long-chain-fatty-acid--CoA ligase [Alphaproteobacteria bacterium]MDE2112171.1 long-chain-fatty-acid--CoA ligase [Alphaproteobacteria bacterium]MDE2495802.1 long-chain-fatty-acid--CoA ligase [Alphaproteobacteria bacterium]
MLGLMQDWPLLIHKIIDHAALYYREREVVTRAPEGPIERTNYGEIAVRARQVAAALDKRGIKLGDRVGTLAWNTARHLESWYGIAGIGAVYHTLNPRLFPDQIAWIANDAGDRALFFDVTFAELVAKLAPHLKTVEFYVALTDRAHLPKADIPNLVAYEDFIAGMPRDFAWKEFDEHTACGLCYTSGTTGNPKGALYSHRSNTLLAMIACSTDTLGLSGRDAVLPVVPMFHANAWGIAFAAPMTGAKLVMPGPRLDGASLCALFAEEKVTMTAAVPTVWLGALQYLEQSGKTLPYLKKVLIGGAACPRSMIEIFEKKYGVEVIHSWGMTEMSPLGTLGTLKAKFADLPYEKKLDYKMRQGHPPFGVEMRIVDAENRELPRDGKTMGKLKVRGPAVAKAYFKGEGAAAFDAEGWFDTGDVATLDSDGYMTITDRAKDVIKSGGEWISSIDIENLAVGHPAVAEAAVIGVRHPKWDERPLLIVVVKPGQTASKKDILDHLAGKIATWWMPDEVVFVDAIPHSATGKIQKTALRERFAEFRLPDAAG